MLSLYGPESQKGESLQRREMLKIGGLGLTGLGLPQLLDANHGKLLAASPSAKQQSSFGKAKNCIILFQSGGAAQMDTYDPKPNAPDDIRGTFNPISTAVPGVHVCDSVPLTAKVLDRGVIVRSVTHPRPDHASGGYAMFTGYEYEGTAGQANFMARSDHPHVGAAIAKMAPGSGPMVPWAIIPRRLDAGSGRRAGQWGGRLGSKYDPLQPGGDPNEDGFKLDHLPLVANRDPRVFTRRRKLIDQINSQVEYLDKTSDAQALAAGQQKAIDVLSSDAVRRAVDLSSEDPKLREAYGRNLFGQSVLLGRRFLQAGSRVIQCSWLRTQGEEGYAWDSHWNNLKSLRNDLCPPFDQALYALINDLEETGELDETLVVVTGEFGRTPRINKDAGRDHWSNVFSLCMFGAGINAGQVYGASDGIAGYPAADPVTPADITATIYHCLGIDPHSEMLDQNERPMRLSEGHIISDILS